MAQKRLGPKSEPDNLSVVLVVLETQHGNSADLRVTAAIKIAMRRADIDPSEQIWVAAYPQKRMPRAQRDRQEVLLVRWVSQRLASGQLTVISPSSLAVRALRQAGIMAFELVPPPDLLKPVKL